MDRVSLFRYFYVVSWYRFQVQRGLQREREIHATQRQRVGQQRNTKAGYNDERQTTFRAKGKVGKERPLMRRERPENGTN